jgi:hypothetical protein
MEGILRKKWVVVRPPDPWRAQNLGEICKWILRFDAAEERASRENAIALRNINESRTRSA